MVRDACEADSSDETILVDLGPRSYPIRVVSDRAAQFGPFARDALDATWAGRACSRCALVADHNSARLAAPYAQALRAVGLDSIEFAIAPGERSKNLEHAGEILEWLAEARADRHTAVVAVGGGVVGDLAGFVAATYARGLPLLMIPTSLLAQVDSSVGGKVGVNLPRAKNIVGAFHQPVGVFIDTAVLGSLPVRELRCGLAEVIKYGVILDADFFGYLEANVEPISRLSPARIRTIVARSCRLKAGVVTRDEREETGLRAVLNFGHTIGHAIEAVAGYGGEYQHGEAVAVGMVAEARLAERLGWITPELTERLVLLLKRFGLPTTIPDFAAGALMNAMGRDKKNRGGRIRFVLPRELGHVELTDQPDENDVRAALRAVTTPNPAP